MSKAPSFQFYPSDWMRDMTEHPLEIEGAWIRICCALFYSDTKGTSDKTVAKWARILRVGERKCISIIAYLDNHNIAEVIKQKESIQITSRRMVRDEYIRKMRQFAGLQGGNPELKRMSQKGHLVKQDLNNQNCLSSSSSSSSSSKNLKVFVDKTQKPRFSTPTLLEIKSYCEERQNAVDPQKFIDFYTSKGWKIGKNSMKDWKAAIRTWEKNDARDNNRSFFKRDVEERAEVRRKTRALVGLSDRGFGCDSESDAGKADLEGRTAISDKAITIPKVETP